MDMLRLKNLQNIWSQILGRQLNRSQAAGPGQATWESCLSHDVNIIDRKSKKRALGHHPLRGEATEGNSGHQVREDEEAREAGVPEVGAQKPQQEHRSHQLRIAVE